MNLITNDDDEDRRTTVKDSSTHGVVVVDAPAVQRVGSKVAVSTNKNTTTNLLAPRKGSWCAHHNILYAETCGRHHHYHHTTTTTTKTTWAAAFCIMGRNKTR
jgi:hypothetical protein